MRQTTERQQPGKAEPNKQAWLDVETQTETLLELVQEAQAEQTALLEAYPPWSPNITLVSRLSLKRSTTRLNELRINWRT